MYTFQELESEKYLHPKSLDYSPDDASCENTKFSTLINDIQS